MKSKSEGKETNYSIKRLIYLKSTLVEANGRLSLGVGYEKKEIIYFLFKREEVGGKYFLLWT